MDAYVCQECGGAVQPVERGRYRCEKCGWECAAEVAARFLQPKAKRGDK